MYNLNQYIFRESPVHRRDPRVKIIAVTALSVLTLQASAVGLLAITLVLLFVSQLARIPSSYLLKALRPFMPFFVCLFLLYIFFTPGPPVPTFSWGPVSVSYPGLRLGLLQVGKFLLLAAAAFVLTMTTSPTEIVIGLERLLRPLGIVGISSHNVAMMISLALRFVPDLLGEMDSMTQAQLARGANFNNGRLSGKIRAIIYLAGPLAINVFRRSDELVDAMEARGYQTGPRTYLYEPVFTRMDYLLTIAIIAITIATLAWHP